MKKNCRKESTKLQEKILSAQFFLIILKYNCHSAVRQAQRRRKRAKKAEEGKEG